MHCDLGLQSSFVFVFELKHLARLPPTARDNGSLIPWPQYRPVLVTLPTSEAACGVTVKCVWCHSEGQLARIC